MLPRIEQFIKERQYIVGVTAATVEGYRNCLCYPPLRNPRASGIA